MALMSGLEAVEIRLSKLEFSRRIDSEYYRKSLLKWESMILGQNHTTLSEVANFLIGPFGSSYDTDNYVEKSDYRYIRGQDVKPFLLMDTEPRYIEKVDFERLSRYSLKENDILVSVVGTLGNACIVRDNDIPAIFSCKSTVIRIKEINAHYVIAYLNSKQGRELLIRKERGAIQKGLNLDDLRLLPIPIFSNNFETYIESYMRNANDLLDKAKILYATAESCLLSALGLQDFTPSTGPVAVKSFAESFGASGRLDAEYYQPMYEEILETIKSYKGGYSSIDELAKYLFTGEYSENYENKSDGLRFYIRGTNMNNGQVIIDDSYYVNPDNFTRFVASGDIITGRVGTLGVFAEICDNIDGAVYSDNVLCFRLPEQYIPSVYTLLLNTKFMRALVERASRGSVQQRLNQETLRGIIVPLIECEAQQKIAHAVQQSFALRHKSDYLLESAKQAVEMAIEQGEGTAISWIDMQTRD